MSVFILPKIYVGSSNKEKKINECTRSSCTVLLRKIMEKKQAHFILFFVQQLQSLSCLCLNLEIVFNMSSTRYIYLGRILPTKCVAPSQRNSSSPVIVSSDWEKNGIALSGRQYMKNKTNKNYVGFSLNPKIWQIL